MAKTRRTIVLIAALSALATTLAIVPACRRRGAMSEQPGTPPSMFTDEIGRGVNPRALPARRVVSLAPNVTELLFAVGAGAAVVGVDNYSDEPAGFIRRVPKLGSDYEPSIEKIVALSPDIVFTSLSANRRETVEALERLDIPVFVTDTRSISGMDRIYRSLGAFTGHVQQAEEQILRLHRGLDAVARRVSARPKAQVLIVVWDDPLYVAGRGTFTHDLIELAGGANVAADVTGFSRYSLERVLRLGPEVIVLPTHSAVEQGPKAVAYWSRWSELPAVRTGRVKAIEDATIIRPGARLVEGADLLARLIHPEIPSP